MIVGVDPGKTGGFAALTGKGEVAGLWEMPTDGRRICPVGVAQVYHEVCKLCAYDDTVEVVVEEIYTLPTDALAKKRFQSACEAAERAGQLLDAHDGGYLSPDHFTHLRAQYDDYSTYSEKYQYRPDGRVGLLGYAKGAGMLHMPALWRWPIREVKPSIWCRDIKKGVDQKLSTKEQSIKVAKAIWPAHFEKDHELTFVPGKKRKPHDGLIEAALIAYWGLKN